MVIEWYEGEYGQEVRFSVLTENGEPLSLVDSVAKLLVEVGAEIREIPLVSNGDELIYVVEPGWAAGEYTAQIELSYPSAKVRTPVFVIRVRESVKE